jgi:hypothetical protein
VALLALVCLSTVATPAFGQSAENSTGEWRTLGPTAEDVDRANRTRVGLDLSAVLDRDTDRIASHHRDQTLSVAVDSAASDEERYNIVSAELRRLEETLQALDNRQRRTTAAYSDGDLLAASLLDRVSGIGDQAKTVEERLIAIRTVGRQIESRAVVTRSNDLLIQARTLQGTVRNHVTTVHRGNQAPVSIYHESSNRSLVLATTTNQDFIREVTMVGYRGDTGTSIGLARAVSLVANSYPELYEARQGLEVDGSRRAGSYRIGIVGTGEFLTAYVDADSRRVFREDRRVSLARLQLTTGPNTTTSAYRMVIDHTYRGGPMRVAVERTNAEPVRADISIDGERVGTTGKDGSLWVVSPPGPVSVTASVNGTELTVPFTAPAPPPLNATAPE